jgi:outer membrane protein TolC
MHLGNSAPVNLFKFVLLASFQSHFSLAVASQPTGLIVEHVVIGRKNNPDYRAAVISVEAAEHKLQSTKASLLPQITLSSGTSRSDREEENQGLGVVTSENRKIKSTFFQLQLRQPIYRRGLIVELEKSINALEMAKAELSAADQILQKRVLANWFEVLSLREQIVTQVKLVAASEELAKEVSQRLIFGEATRQDADMAKADLDEAVAALEELRTELQIAEDLVRDSVGSSAMVPNSATIADLLRLIGTRYELGLVESVKRESVTLRRLRLEEVDARLNIEASESDQFPTLDAYISANRGDNDSISTIKDERRVGVQFSIPLFTSGAISSKIRQAESIYRRSLEKTLAAEFEVVREAVSASRRLETSGRKLTAAKQLVDASLVKVLAVERGLAAGVNSRSDVAKAKRDLYAAQRSLITVKQARFTSWLHLMNTKSGLRIDLEGVMTDIPSR